MRVHPPAPNHGVTDPGLATYSSRIKGQPGAAALSAFQLYGLGTKVRKRCLSATWTVQRHMALGFVK
jgi:hypothetical protein